MKTPLLNKLKAIWSPAMGNDNVKAKKKAPWQVVKDIRNTYNKAEQARIAEILVKQTAPPAEPNPYAKKG